MYLLPYSNGGMWQRSSLKPFSLLLSCACVVSMHACVHICANIGKRECVCVCVCMHTWKVVQEASSITLLLTPFEAGSPRLTQISLIWLVSLVSLLQGVLSPPSQSGITGSHCTYPRGLFYKGTNAICAGSAPPPFLFHMQISVSSIH